MVEQLLTSAERHAMAQTASLWNYLCENVVGNGPSREADLRELVFHIHGIQRAILSQAAGRAYPDDFRLLGEVIEGGRDEGLESDRASEVVVEPEHYHTRHARIPICMVPIENLGQYSLINNPNENICTACLAKHAIATQRGWGGS